jgi:hypothetical protein
VQGNLRVPDFVHAALIGQTLIVGGATIVNSAR